MPGLNAGMLMLGSEPEGEGLAAGRRARSCVEPARPVRLIEGSCASLACPIRSCGRQHAELGRDDVGPARQQLRGQAGGYRRNLHPVLQAAGRHLELPGRHADQGGQRVLGHVAGAAQLQQVLGQPVDLRALAQHLRGGHQAVVAHRLVDAQDLLVLGQGALLLLDLLVELEDLEVRGRDAGHQRQVAGAPVRLGRMELGGLRLGALARPGPRCRCPS